LFQLCFCFAYSGRANDRDAHGLGQLDQLLGALLRHTLGDDGNGLELGELEQLDCALVDRAERGKVDHDIDVGELGHGILHLFFIISIIIVINKSRETVVLLPW